MDILSMFIKAWQSISEADVTFWGAIASIVALLLTLVFARDKWTTFYNWAKQKIFGVPCDSCSGKKTIPCSNFNCVDGHISPSGAGGHGAESDFEIRGNTTYFCVRDYNWHNSQGGRGSVSIHFKVMYPLYRFVVGELTLGERPIGPNKVINERRICIPLDNTKLEKLKGKVGHEVSYGMLTLKSEAKIIDKGEICPVCGGDGFESCPRCRGTGKAD